MSTHIEIVRSVVAECSASLKKHRLSVDSCAVPILIWGLLLKRNINSYVVTGYAVFDSYAENRMWVSVKESNTRNIIVDLGINGGQQVYRHKTLLPYGMNVVGNKVGNYKCVEVNGQLCLTDHMNVLEDIMSSDARWKEVACELLL